MTTGNRVHITIPSVPSNAMTRVPRRNPPTVPATARTAVVLVATALLRSTESVPSTTHSPFWIGNTIVTTTASASAIPVRRLLITVTDPVLR